MEIRGGDGYRVRRLGERCPVAATAHAPSSSPPSVHSSPVANRAAPPGPLRVRYTMPRTFATASLALAAGLWLATPAPAQMIVQYNFNNTTATDTTAAPSSMNPNVTANSTVNGANIVQDYSLVDYGQQVLRAAITNTATPDEASAVNGGSYWGFTVQPNTGFKMNFSSFTFDAARGGAGTPRTWYL